MSRTKSKQDFLNLESSAVTHYNHVISTLFYFSDVRGEKKKEAATCRTESETRGSPQPWLPGAFPACTPAAQRLCLPSIQQDFLGKES